MVNKSKYLSTVLVVLICGSILGVMGYFYWNLRLEHDELTADYTSLEVEYSSLRHEHLILNESYNSLTVEHEALNARYVELQGDYASLERVHEELELEYRLLNKKYEDLDAKYTKLFTDHTLLKDAFNKPLTYKKTPTVQELLRWLSEDPTDTIRYDDPDFVCGDFAVMLALHAKTKHWDMGVVAIFGYNRDTREDYAHVLNAIISTEGLEYIEPQTDDVWYYEDHEEIRAGRIYGMPGDEWIYVEDIGIILWY